jgi:hypothetical protein
MTKVIEFIPVSEHALLFPPEPIKHNLPNWFKNMPPTTEGSSFTATHFNEENKNTNLTVKRCVPFMDYMTSGYLIKFHTDILIDPKDRNGLKEFEWRYPGPETPIALHSHKQCPVKTFGHNRTYIKFTNQWIIRTQPGYSCLFMQPFEIEKNIFKLFPAIVDTDKYDNVINFPGFVTSEENFMINAGDPLMTVFPFKRDDWKADIKTTVTSRSKNKFNVLDGQFFYNVYRNFFHAKKRYD